MIVYNYKIKGGPNHYSLLNFLTMLHINLASIPIDESFSSFRCQNSELFLNLCLMEVKMKAVWMFPKLLQNIQICILRCVLLPNTMLFHLEKTISEKSEERSWWNLELTNSYLFSQVIGNFVETLCGNCVFPQTVDTRK